MRVSEHPVRENSSLSPERWAAVEQLFTRALDLPRDQSSKFLADACGDDDALRRDVSALLDSHDVVVASDGTGDAFLETLDAACAAVLVEAADAMPLPLRAVLGDRYVVERSIGAGGMADGARARALFRESLSVRRTIGDRAGIAECERAFATLASVES
jgi:serine/threonine-protein kinase